MIRSLLTMDFKKTLGCKLKRKCLFCVRKSLCTAAYWDGVIRVVETESNNDEVMHVYDGNS